MESGKKSFRQGLNLWDSTALVAGSMIGSGIFIVSADMARNLGSPGWLILAWVITGIVTIIAALSYGELAAMMPKAGGQYVYLREAFNPLSGFLYGWTLFTVIQTGTIAAVAMAFAKYSGVLFPWFSESHVIFEFSIIKIHTGHLLAITVIWLLTLLNMRGLQGAKWVQNVFTVSKVVLLLGFVALGFFMKSDAAVKEANEAIYWQPVSLSGNPVAGWALIAAIGVAMVGSIFSADAWNNITFAAGEVKNPGRNLPLSLVFGVSIVLVLYVLVNLVYIRTLPIRGIENSPDVIASGIQHAVNDRVGTASMFSIFGSSAAVFMAILIMISTFGCNNGLILSGARVYYAMAKDDLFFRNVGDLNEYGVPSRGLISQAIWASLLTLTGTYSNLLDFVVVTVLIFYALTIAGIFRLRKTKPDTERPYKAWGYPVLPAIYIAFVLLMLVILIIYKPQYTYPGIGIVLLGIPVYYIRKQLAH